MYVIITHNNYSEQNILLLKMNISPSDDSLSGLETKDYQASVATLKVITETLDADCILLREKQCGNAGIQGQYLIRKRADTQDFMEVR